MISIKDLKVETEASAKEITMLLLNFTNVNYSVEKLPEHITMQDDSTLFTHHFNLEQLPASDSQLESKIHVS